MTKLYENIKMLCKERNISIKKFEELNGFKHNTVPDWRNKMPLGDTIYAAANFFDVSVDFLMGNTDNRFSHKSKMTPQELKLLETQQKLGLSEYAVEYIVTMMKETKESFEPSE